MGLSMYYCVRVCMFFRFFGRSCLRDDGMFAAGIAGVCGCE